MSRSFYQSEDAYWSENGWNAGLGALTIDGGGNVGVPTSAVVGAPQASAGAGSGPLLGTFDGQPCYGIPPRAGQCTQGSSICSLKCRFAQCVNAGALPASYCGDASTQSCPTGYVLSTSGQCVPSGGAGTNPCPTGQVLNASGQCVPGTTSGGPTAGCPAGTYLSTTGQCLPLPVGGTNPLTCTSPYVVNATGTQCVLPSGTPAPGTSPTCAGYMVLNPTTNQCVLSCPSGYVPDPSGTTCDLSSSTTGTSFGSELESFFANYWLYVLIGLGAYLLLKKK
jgi:hypothetical protein